MKIAFMPDTHFGVYDQTTHPKPDDVADAMQHCIAEGVLAEKVGWITVLAICTCLVWAASTIIKEVAFGHQVSGR